MSSILSQTTIITACRSRERYLVESIRTWLYLGCRHIIICDFNGYPHTEGYLSNFGLGKGESIAVHHFGNIDTPWVLSWAYNALIPMIQTKYTLKLDADDSSTANLKTFLESRTSKHLEECFYSGDWRKMCSPGEASSGTFFVSTESLRLCKGYNPYLLVYGYDDIDLYIRLSQNGLKQDFFPVGCLNNKRQDPEERHAQIRIPEEQVVPLLKDGMRDTLVQLNIFIANITGRAALAYPEPLEAASADSHNRLKYSIGKFYSRIDLTVIVKHLAEIAPSLTCSKIRYLIRNSFIHQCLRYYSEVSLKS